MSFFSWRWCALLLKAGWVLWVLGGVIFLEGTLADNSALRQFGLQVIWTGMAIDGGIVLAGLVYCGKKGEC